MNTELSHELNVLTQELIRNLTAYNNTTNRSIHDAITRETQEIRNRIRVREERRTRISIGVQRSVEELEILLNHRD